MQCPQCRYEPTLAEVQRSPDDCLRCGASHSASARSAAPRLKPVRGAGAYVAVAILLLAIISGATWGYSYYKKDLLVGEVERSMRTANGLVSEILDDKAKLTNGEYLEKIPRRIDDLDNLLASTLAIDDGSIPGLAAAAADYVRASRSFLNAFTDDLKLGIQLSVLEAGHKAYSGYPNTTDGARYLAMSSAELEAINRTSLAAVEAESDLSRKIDLLKVASHHAQHLERRAAYLKSREDVRATKAAKDRSLKALHIAGKEIQNSGARVSGLSGRPMPIQPWGIPGM